MAHNLKFPFCPVFLISRLSAFFPTININQEGCTDSPTTCLNLRYHVKLLMLPRSLLNTVRNNSWSHQENPKRYNYIFVSIYKYRYMSAIFTTKPREISWALPLLQAHNQSPGLNIFYLDHPQPPSGPEQPSGHLQCGPVDSLWTGHLATESKSQLAHTCHCCPSRSFLFQKTSTPP